MNDETQPALAPPGILPAPAADTAPGATPAIDAETLTQMPADMARAAFASASPAPAGAIPGYEILGELGRGGMGAVYKARHLKLNRIVAIKMVLNAQHADPRELTRFLEEAIAVAAIKHPHVIQMYEIGEVQGRPYMVMECLEGGSLVSRLRAGGKLDPRAAAELVKKLAQGVQAAHDRGIVHRDLKPHNVLLDLPPQNSPLNAWGEPKVMDFGLAKRGGGAELTQTGAVMGTPAYMAPEQAKGETKKIGPPADIYALGVILYECLCGTVPFSGSDAWSVIRQVIDTEPESVTRRTGGIPRDLDRICRKCLAKEPSERYATAAALAEDLQRFLNGEALRGPRTGIWYAGQKLMRRWWRPFAGASALVVLVLVAWVIPSPLFQASKQSEKSEPVVEPKDEPLQDKKEEDAIVKLRRDEVARRVETLRRIKLVPDRVSPHPVVRLPLLPAPDFTAFRVITDDRLVDMRGWRPNPTNDPNLDCAIVYQTRREMMKIAPATELRAETRTSGRDVYMRALRPNPERAKAFAAEKPGIVGEQAMKVRQLVFDVGDIPVDTEFALQFANTFLQSLQTPEECWFGVIGYEGAFKTSMLMLFPPDRPFRDFQLRVAQTQADDPEKRKPVPYTGPVITFAASDKSWLYWEIPAPKANHVYRVDWTW